MGVAADQLLHDAPGHVVDVPRAFFRRHLRVEDHLEEDVAQLLAEALPVAGIDRVQHLVGLLQQVPGERAVGLLPVPGTPAGLTEPRHHPDQVQQALAAIAGRDGALGDVGEGVVGGSPGHGEEPGVALAVAGVAVAVAGVVAVLRIGSTSPVVGSNRPYFGFTMISTSAS